jgi:uncharacterized protein (TIGR01777 family)
VKAVFEKILPVASEIAFDYHARLGALERLIPPWENLQIVRTSNSLLPGSEAEIRIGFGPIAFSWTALHELYDPPRLFSDRQLRGPFKNWNHIHRFLATIEANESRLIDEIEYELPAGSLGRWLADAKIKRMLDRTFAYRQQVTHDDLAFRERLIAADARNAESRAIGISGSSGLLGSEIVRLLQVLGHRVIRLRRSNGLSSNEGSSTQSSVVWEPTKGLSDPAALNGIDAFIHLAGEGLANRRWSKTVKDSIWSSRVDATNKLCEQLGQLSNPPRAFVTASGVGYYGSTGDRWMTENDPPGVDFLGRLAAAWEGASSRLVDLGCRWTAGRLGIILSNRGGALRKMLPLFRWGLGGRLGSGRQYWGCIGVQDAAAAFVWLALNPRCSGPYNLVADSPTNSEFTRSVAKAVSRPTLFPAPAFALRMAMGEMADAMLLASTRTHADKLIASGYIFRQPNLNSILESELGLKR